jgi:hypothetical protein
MKLALSDMANWAQILSLPVSVALWYFTREKAAKFWKKYLKVILSAFAILTLITFSRVGWLDWLTHEVTWPVWALMLLGLSVPVVALLILWLRSLLEKQPESRDYLLYVSDNIDGIEWHWSYSEGQLDDFRLSAFCSNHECSCRLEAQLQRIIPPEISLKCNHCGYVKDFRCDLGSSYPKCDD